jgi:hypothetical protein
MENPDGKEMTMREGWRRRVSDTGPQWGEMRSASPPDDIRRMSNLLRAMRQVSLSGIEGTVICPVCGADCHWERTPASHFYSPLDRDYDGKLKDGAVPFSTYPARITVKCATTGCVSGTLTVD